MVSNLISFYSIAFRCCEINVKVIISSLSLLTAFSLSTTFNLDVYSQSLRFEHFTVADGLSNANITASVQDPLGFMWFATHDGLNRFDGYNFTVYRHLPNDRTSLANSNTSELLLDEKGRLWIATLSGLDRFDPIKGIFIHHRHEPNNSNSLSNDKVSELVEDQAGHLWIGTANGLNRFDPSTNRYTRYLYNPESPGSENQIISLLEDSDGMIWIGTAGGLNRLNPKTGDLKRFEHRAGDSHSISDNRIRSLYQDKHDTLWVGTCGGGLHTFDRQTESFSRLFPDTGSPIYAPHTDQTVYGTCAAAVNFIHEDQSGILWIGSFNAGIHRYDRSTGNMTYHAHNPTNPTSLSENTFASLYEDPQGRIWIGTLHGGLNMVDPQESKFSYHTHDPSSPNSLSDKTVWSFEEGASNELWIGTLRGGLNRFNRLTGEFTHYKHDPDIPGSISSNWVADIYRDSSGEIWIGTWNGGLDRFNPSNQRFTHFRHESDNPNSLSGTNVWEIDEDHSKNLWIGTLGSGLNRFDPSSQTFVRFKSDAEDSTSLSHDWVWVLYVDSEETLWVGTSNGLSRFNPDDNSFIRYLTGRVVTAIGEDTDSTLWVGTQTDGIHRFDRTTGSTQHYTIEDGLPSNAIACLIEDESRDLWISTLSKLSRFDPQTETFRNYEIGGGLEHNGYVWQSCFRSRSGELYFGGYEGYYPEEIQDNPNPPKINITAFKVFDERMAFEANQPEVKLTHDQNNLSFDYVGIDFTAPEQIRYRYQLEGFDENWVDAGIQRTARYAKVPHGEYDFHVTAANSDGVWNEEGASFRVVILPPWWRTWWAYGLYGLLLAAGIFAVDRFQRRRLIAKERERARDRELRKEKAHAQQLEEAYSELEDSLNKLTAAQDQLVQQEKLASLGQLTAGIAHEIKNPLNFVNNFSDLSLELVEETKDEVTEKLASQQQSGDHIIAILDDIETNLRKINEHGSRADTIVKSMLQHSRGGDGKMEPVHLNSLIKEYVNLASHGMRAGSEPINVDIELDLDENIGEVSLIAEDFSRVIINLCNNAFDALRVRLTSKEDQNYDPKLFVRTYQNDDEVTIEIEDNGPGIPDEIKDKILQPFFTTKKGTQGTGLGLSITNDIIKAHGGHLEIESEENRFTRFRIHL